MICSPISRNASSMMQLYVMPSSAFSVTDGVMSFPSRTMKMFEVAHSATCPFSLREMASSKPACRPSSLANALFT